MSLTQDQIKTLKKLTALSWEKTVSIDSVLESFDSIAQVDTSSITTSTRSGKGSLLPRIDIVKASETTSDALLACSKQRVVGHQIALTSIMQGE
jgi:Asp-tRNA(Asn)/Glu-tRNA(Gln) amidotransferase C subunit